MFLTKIEENDGMYMHHISMVWYDGSANWLRVGIVCIYVVKL